MTFPQPLIDAQRAWFRAVEAVADYARTPGEAEGGEWTEEQRTEWWRLQKQQEDATLALYRARAGTPFDTHERRQALKDHVRRLDEAEPAGG